ncbi:MAG TPA: prepilin-type N-terminal cleavage/methylation domain-containing protein, partial [Gammaproteobacteria bacterium]|nr:prepilin-type N-terminal cleavage/methylation domain-containing protein [Gammaproteobacteria bacterium]
MNSYSHNPQSGFSLVEILVAMTLSLVLLGGTIVIYASSKDSYRLQENIAGMQ